MYCDEYLANLDTASLLHRAIPCCTPDTREIFASRNIPMPGILTPGIERLLIGKFGILAAMY